MTDKPKDVFTEATALGLNKFPPRLITITQDKAQLERLYPKGGNGKSTLEIKANQFVTGANERVLTDDGQQGMHGKSGIGSSTERHQGQVAAAIFANCAQLDNRQLDEIIEWVGLYKK